jgi:hypothetical protein
MIQFHVLSVNHLMVVSFLLQNSVRQNINLIFLRYDVLNFGLAGFSYNYSFNIPLSNQQEIFETSVMRTWVLSGFSVWGGGQFSRRQPVLQGKQPEN